MPNDPKDRHVVAAVKAGAQVITTANLKDFSALPEGVEAQSPDEFLCNLFDLDPNGCEELLRDQAADLVKPPMTFEELLDRLVKVVPDFVGAVAITRRNHVTLDRPALYRVDADALVRGVIAQMAEKAARGVSRPACFFTAIL